MRTPDPVQRFIAYVTTLYRWFIGRKLAIVIFLIVALALPAYALYINVFLPLKTAGQLEAYGEYQPSPADTSSMRPDPDGETLEKVRAIEALEIEKAYLNNRLKLAKSSDSVYMSINLADSVIHLEIKGVEVRECPIAEIQVSRRLKKAPHDQLLGWLSGPFDLEKDISTIPKIPYVIKEAPKDTLEAQAQSARPMPVDTASVCFTLYFDRDLVVEMRQAEEPHAVDKGLIRDYRQATQALERKEAFRAIFRGKAPEQPIHILLYVNQADARAIYRGIPVNAMLALKL